MDILSFQPMEETPASLLYQPNQKLQRSGTKIGAIVAAQSSEHSLQIPVNPGMRHAMLQASTLV